MARARNIKPGFFRNADLVELSFEARLLFIGLWTIADKAGRLEDRPKQIKMELFPADNMDCDSLIANLEASGFVARYEVEGKRYLQVINFAKHQNPHRDEKASTLPAMRSDDAETEQEQNKHDASTVQAPCKQDANTVAIGLIPDSLNLIPDSLQDQGVQENQKCKKPTASATRLPADWVPSDDDFDFCAKERADLAPLDVADRFRDYWIAQPGAKGRKLDWSATWRNWVRNEKHVSQQKLTQHQMHQAAISESLFGYRKNPERLISGEVVS